MGLQNQRFVGVRRLHVLLGELLGRSNGPRVVAFFQTSPRQTQQSFVVTRVVFRDGFKVLNGLVQIAFLKRDQAQFQQRGVCERRLKVATTRLVLVSSDFGKDFFGAAVAFEADQGNAQGELGAECKFRFLRHLHQGGFGSHRVAVFQVPQACQEETRGPVLAREFRGRGFEGFRGGVHVYVDAQMSHGQQTHRRKSRVRAAGVSKQVRVLAGRLVVALHGVEALRVVVPCGRQVESPTVVAGQNVPEVQLSQGKAVGGVGVHS